MLRTGRPPAEDIFVDQIAALPHRIDAAGARQVLLVTSRQTGRWVVPKGNLIPGLTPQESAAQEAWEEAGVVGTVDPTPLGSFAYRKRRRRGEEELTVRLFALAVAEQRGDWPECHQRVTQWFDPAAAAAAVEEPALAAMIAGFRPPAGPVARAGPVPGRAPAAKGSRLSMLGWFQALMPKQGRFFDQFEAHAATLVAGSDALNRLLAGTAIPDQVATIVAREHEADTITAEVLQDVRRVFVTPFDRSAIIELIGVMDDAIDQMNQTAGSITLYGVTEFAPPMRAMSDIIVEAARLTQEAMPLLRSLAANAPRLHELTARIIEIEGQADDLHDQGLRALFEAHRGEPGNPMAFIIGREIYGHLERVVDRFEDVANEIQGLVIDHA